MTGNSGRSAGAMRSEGTSVLPEGPTGAKPVTSSRFPSVFLWPEQDATSELTVSVVICTRNRPEELRECLEHISRLTPLADEVLVVDNSSGDAETKRLAEVYGARYVLEQTSGLSRARNRGLAESRCDLVAYLDDDCVPDAQWLEYLKRPFFDEQVAAVTGEIVGFTGQKGQSLDVESAVGEMRYVNRNTPRWFETASFGGVGSGGNMAFRKRTCGGPALFDERLGRGAPFRIAEENCAFASLLSEGYSMVWTSMARVGHPDKPMAVDEEAKSTIAYWLLLFAKFQENRLDLLYFLGRRILRRPPAWRLNTINSDRIVSSGWGVKLKAFAGGVWLFLRSRNFSPDQK